MAFIYQKMLKLSVLVMLGIASLAINAAQFSDNFVVDNDEILYVKTDVGSIYVQTHNSNSVKIDVEVKGDDAEDFNVKFEQTAKGVSVYGERKQDWGWGNQHIKVRFLVYVPEQYNLDLNTSGGSISVEDLIGNVDAQTSGGSIKMGDITGNVDVHTSGGSINVDSVYGDIDADTSGGSIKVEFKKQITENAKLTTSGGSITATLPDNIALDISASTSGGRVKSEFDVNGQVKKQSIKGKINGGGPKLILRTSGGSVKINKA